ncbi:hypothetical protein C8Q72DRAFT_550124 [Fomitopsis betulina]|nr:hypothetical protein C8Q72DRAFT_550124 [Fomitopsis betulina]
MLLRRERSEFRPTSSLLRRLTVHVINRGVLTAILQSLQAILFAAYRSNGFYWSLVAFPGTRVYIISTLAVLNARRSNRLGVDSAVSFSTDIQLDAVQSHRSRAYSRYIYQEQPMTPPSNASDRFIICTTVTEVVHHVD